MLTRYHMDDPGLFLSTHDFWDVASDPTTDGADGPATAQLTGPLVGL